MGTKRPHKKRVMVVHTALVRESTVLYGTETDRKIIHNPKAAAEFAAAFLRGSDKERCYVCCLDAKGEPVTMEEAAVGSRNVCQVGIADVLKTAVLSNAVGMIFFHNHPSGRIKPSSDDIEITKRLKQAGQLLGVSLEDHIIIGDDDYYSMKEHGEL